jgi:hypothetical protein
MLWVGAICLFLIAMLPSFGFAQFEPVKDPNCVPDYTFQFPPAVPCDDNTLCDRYPIGRFNYTWTTVISSEDIGAGPLVFQNQNIRITGILFIDNDVSFENCRIVMSSGAKIEILNGGTLTSVGSKFFSCDFMWRGIVVLDGGTLSLRDGTEIEDAARAVEVMRPIGTPQAIGIFGTIFNRNYVDIHADFRQNELGLSFTTRATFIPNRFERNYFLCTCDLRPSTMSIDLVNTSNPPITWSGVQLWLCTTSIGSSSPVSCAILDDLVVGMRISDSQLIINGKCTFSNMNDFIPPANFITDATGWAITANNNSNLVVGLSNPSFFNNNITGTTYGGGAVWTRASALNVSNCTFFNNSKCVLVQSTTGNQRVILNNNAVTMQQDNFYAFKVNRSPTVGNSQKILIQQNQIERLGVSNNPFPGDPGFPSLHAIQLNCGASGSSNIAWITDNTFKDYTRFNAGWPSFDVGIHIVQSIGTGLGTGHRIKVQNNKINFLQTDPSDVINGKIGILVESLPGSVGISVADNEITYNDFPFYNNWGILATNTQGVDYCSNVIDNMVTSMGFLFNNTGSNIVSNEMSNYQTGLSIRLGGLGTQLRRDNKWFGALLPGGFDADAGNIGNAGLTPYFVSNAADPIVNPPNTFPPSWFNESMQGAPITNCGPVPPVPPDGGCVGCEEFGPVDEGIINGQLMGNVSAPDAWVMRMIEMDRLQRNPQWLSGSSAATQFYNTTANQQAGRFAATLRMVEATNQAASTQYGPNADQLAHSMDSLSQLIHVADSVRQSVGTPPATQLSLTNNIHQWANQLSQQQSQLQTVWNQAAQYRQNGWQTALNHLAPMQTYAVHDANQKQLLTLVLTMAINGGLDAAQQQQLAALANQDPTTGGRAVLDAVNFLLPPCAVDTDNRESGDSAGTVKQGVSNLVYPNPVSDLLYVQTPDAQHQWRIMDVQGQWQSNGTTDVGTTALPVGQLHNGLYVLQLIDTKGEVQIYRFIVIH